MAPRHNQVVALGLHKALWVRDMSPGRVDVPAFACRNISIPQDGNVLQVEALLVIGERGTPVLEVGKGVLSTREQLLQINFTANRASETIEQQIRKSLPLERAENTNLRASCHHQVIHFRLDNPAWVWDLER